MMKITAMTLIIFGSLWNKYLEIIIRVPSLLQKRATTRMHLHYLFRLDLPGRTGHSIRNNQRSVKLELQANDQAFGEQRDNELKMGGIIIRSRHLFA